MTLPHVNAGEPARAAEQNDLIDTVNGHTGSITSATDILGTHETRLDELETVPSGGSHAGTYFGQWTDDNAGDAGLIVDNAGGRRVVDLDYAVGTPVGCSLSAGIFTPHYAGMWAMTISLQYQASDSLRAMWVAAGSVASNPTGLKLGAQAAPSADAQSTSLITRMDANESYSIYAAVWQGSPAVNIWRAHGNAVTACWLGP